MSGEDCDVEPEAEMDEVEMHGVDIDLKFENIYSQFKAMEKRFSELEDTITILSQANIDLILIEMHAIGNNLSYAEELLNNIGTLDQFNKLRDIEKMRGVNMAYTTSKHYLEIAGSDARGIKPTLKAIKNSMDKISKKLKYVNEA